MKEMLCGLLNDRVFSESYENTVKMLLSMQLSFLRDMKKFLKLMVVLVIFDLFFTKMSSKRAKRFLDSSKIKVRVSLLVSKFFSDEIYWSLCRIYQSSLETISITKMLICQKH